MSYDRRQQSSYESRKKRRLSPIRGLHKCDQKTAEIIFDSRSQRSQSQAVEPSHVAVMQPEVTVQPSHTEDLNNPILDGRTMPTHQEIIAEATKMFMQDQAHVPDLALGETLPEESELREGGYVKKAQLSLMTSTPNLEVDQYIANLKVDLEEHGYTIVPLSEAPAGGW